MKHDSIDSQFDTVNRVLLGLDHQIQAKSGDLSHLSWRPVPGIPLEQIGIQFDSQGLIPAVTQDAASGEVLMVAWMNQQALQRTLETGQVHFWSRSRQELWRKGATSGHVMRVREIWVDCDADTLLLKVTPAGPACHTNAPSCFYRRLA